MFLKSELQALVGGLLAFVAGRGCELVGRGCSYMHTSCEQQDGLLLAPTKA